MTSLKPQDRSKPLFTPDPLLNIQVIIFILASVVIMHLDHRERHLDDVRAVLSGLIYPLQAVIQIPLQTGVWLSEQFINRQALLDENYRLRNKQLIINAQLQKLSVLEAENRRLRMLLESSVMLPVNLRERVLIAEVLERTDVNSPYRHRVQINKGLLNGVYRGQPLLDQYGVVGQVFYAEPLTAWVILITDPNHALPVQIDRTGLQTLAMGTGHFQELLLPYLRHSEDVRIGDLLITSGRGGTFTHGYPVAKITQIERNAGQAFAHIVAQPVAQLDRLREVLLIVKETAAPTTQARAP